eukprot:s1750_g14.t1
MNAYADNWSWAALDSELHGPVAVATQKVCQSGRLLIDPLKTWLWAANQTHASAIRQALETIMPGFTIDKVAGAKDLGFQMQYTGNARPGCLRERVEEALQRLRNILYQPWDIDVKAHVIKSSVYAAAFHGVEVYALCQEDLHRIRSMVAQCITQDFARNQTPVLCTMLLPPQLCDPELHVILQAIKTARRWLLQAPHAERTSFLTIASHHQGTTSTRGPASVLKEYLMRLGWTISPAGVIHAGPFTFLNITEVSFQTLQWWAARAWSETAVVLHSKRFKLFHLPRTDVTATAQVLQKFSEGNRKLLFRELSNAFQTGKQKSKWTTDDSLPCLFCNEPDSKEHRMLFCPAMETVRDQHPLAVTLLQEEFPGWIDHPVIFQHSLYDFVAQLHSRMPNVCVSEESKQILHRAVGQHVTLYTDGSCRHPACPSTRYASFALVADIAPDDQTRIEQCDRFLATKCEPDTLVVIAQGRVQGLQGIHRAELTVIALACESIPSFDLHTDSAVSLAAIARVRAATACHDFADHPDYDLLLRIFRTLQVTHVFHKIKAHVELDNHACNLQLYHQLGNKRANDVAIAANLQLLPEVARELEQYHRDISTEQQQLLKVYDYILALQKVKIQVDMSNPAMGVAEQCRIHATNPCELLANWAPQEFWMAPRQVQGQGLEACPYGQQVAIATLKFLRQCQWPTLEYGPLPEPVGISWLEIAFGIMLELQAYLPVKRQDVNGAFCPVFLGTFTAAKLHHTTMTEQSEQARYIFGHVTDLVPERLFPDTPRGQVRSLYMLGETCFTTGLLLRPAFPRQGEVVELVKRCLTNNRMLLDLDFSGVRQWQTDRDKHSWPWNKRLQFAADFRRRVRRVRRQAE